MSFYAWYGLFLVLFYGLKVAFFVYEIAQAKRIHKKEKELDAALANCIKLLKDSKPL